ncbi:hypothetical protein GM3708_2989 [Geminocystis sp. NIES-3708]|uniref:DUF7219 family protein n=1 Tax=Geminocystis sp. NIES-3708 TaxID=1615909 RepID=UPI0005FC60EE|nr:hypothetical protein [Geminocystis sp. NIES-3708]BAQ62583.1 hypothetical protein GM3708_2989 [Geminocystis sp. NIES-3708]
MNNIVLQKVKQDFLYPISSYHGKDYFNGLIPNQKLQKFTSEVTYIAGLHGNGKLSTQQAFEKIEHLCHILD